MGVFSELNKNFESPFIAAKDFMQVGFINLETLNEYCADGVSIVRDAWINPKSKYGEHGVLGVEVGIEGGETMLYNVSIPPHLNETIKELFTKPNLIELINKGKCGIKVRQYFSKTYNKACYSVVFVDI